jgi:hypothetical protein
LLESEGEALLRAAIERGKAGDVSALRLAIERVWPVRERAIQLDGMPQVTSIADFRRPSASSLRRSLKGGITPGEGNALCSLLGGLRQAFETAELSERLADVERRLERPAFGSTRILRS